MISFLWFGLLLVVAGFCWFGGWCHRASRDKQQLAIDSRYFQGLNYLLNEQTDEAIEIFIQMLEVNTETVEAHLALGNLFRRQGEVDKAIRLHQNLIARPSLAKAQRSAAVFQLGQDYLAAGFLGRAENLFLGLVDAKAYLQPGLSALLKIYEKEKEWEKAVKTGVSLVKVSKDKSEVNRKLAHYYCELAEEYLAIGDLSSAKRVLKLALFRQHDCVRGYLLLAKLYLLLDKPSVAVKQLKRIPKKDKAFVTEIIPLLKQCYASEGDGHSLLKQLLLLVRAYPNPALGLLICEHLVSHSPGDARKFLLGFLREHPSFSGVKRLLELKIPDVSGQVRQDYETLFQMFDCLVNNELKYHCFGCGYVSSILNWLCPSCQSWGMVKPKTEAVLE